MSCDTEMRASDSETDECLVLEVGFVSRQGPDVVGVEFLLGRLAGRSGGLLCLEAVK